VKSVSPIASSADSRIGGRGRNAAGTAAITKRSAVSCGGEKVSSPIRVATKAAPQTTATSTARATSRGFNRRGG
jgi:hypothetical protein